MKIICLHHRLTGFTSHQFNEAKGLLEELDRRRRELILLVNRQAPAAIVTALRARAVLDDPTFRLEWSFEERSRRFLDMLHRQVDRLVKADDCVLITVSTQLEAHALTRWLTELPRRKKPWMVILFLSDRWNRSGRDEYERQMAEFRELEAVISSLAPEEARRVIFCALTELLAEELSGLLGTGVAVAPMPLPYGHPPAGSLPSRHPHRPRVAIFGGTRREKGSYLIPGIVKACRPLVDVEFLVQLANNSLTPEEMEVLGRISEEPEVTVIREAMPPAEYEASLNSADLALFPYELIPYRKRTSGVFGEAVAFGKPVVVTAGTWMARQIEAGRAAGTIFEGAEPDSIAEAIARCGANLESLKRSAEGLSDEWRRTISLPAFVDFMERQLALRGPEEQPSRRWFWRR